jgi:ribosomal protein L37AE/L43A
MVTDNTEISHQQPLPAPVGAGRYNVYTGAAARSRVPAAAQLGLEPPRFCSECGRRMIVQVRPDGWWAKCSRHGLVDSKDLETQR